MKPKSVKKKLKQPSFAAGVNRDEVRQGAEELGVDFDEHVAFVIAAMAERADELGLGPRDGEPAREAPLEGPARACSSSLAVLLGVNTIVTDSQTKPRRGHGRGRPDPGALARRRPGARTRGEPDSATPGQPIVLLHCYACSLHWWDKLEPLLAERHRVIRIDLLGFGGSEKPESGYEIPAQARSSPRR